MKPAVPELTAATLATTWGTVRIVAFENVLAACDLPPLPDPLPAMPPFQLLEKSMPPRPPAALAAALAFARAILAGRPPGACPPLHPDVFSNASPFAAAVWRALLRIPRGATATYGDVARALSRPGAARAVGRACGANPLPLFIPCHRVLAANGALGGFSSGTAWKLLLLRGEGACA